MRESVTYQIILEEGREEGEQRGRLREVDALLLDLGTEKLGPPDAAASAAIESSDDLAALHRMARAVLRASSWQELQAAGQG